MKDTGILIPCAFYKVILDTTPPEKMIGFIIPNKPSKKRLSSFAVTVDEVEKVTGCDFFRTVAGRPTSSELEAKRVTVALREQAEREAQAREKAVRDSIAAAEKHVSDSTAAESFLRRG